MGALQSEAVTASGTLSINGAVHADRILVDGMATMKDAVVCKDSLEVNGRVSIEKNLSADKVKVDGSLKTRGDVQCETLSVHGGFNIEGLLNAGQVDIKLNFPCRAHEIGVERITVKRTKKFRVLEQLTGTFAARLKVNVIEGDFIELEYTDADTVRGNEVRIGPGCQIRLVEYKHEMIQHPDAKIGSIQQI
ncbi:polymer-forming cytoskeletal protein [Paenibacillus pini]|uniref:Bactofilin n=1 Tax=Paenibacillus pini JCM 16418 TaxID=1236976 RepID=W7YSY2_9BACL|nr:polymer-forming cytoskeletal protein [Paenibacillus pini]GAF10308.1 hypothetical protein JCM16418_4487 [Paenibacillus pini JCM 16418]